MNVKTIINNIIRFAINLFLPLLYVAFLLFAGTGCAAVSALIEYDVVNGLFPKSNSFIPILIVAAAEISKIFFVFLSKQFDENYSTTDRFIIALLRSALIILSFVATLLFAFYNLYNPEYKTQLEQETQRINQFYQTAITEINERYEREITRAEKKCEKQRQQITQQYQPKINHWLYKMEMEENHRNSKGGFKGPRYKTFQENYHQEKKQHDEALSNVKCDETTTLINKQKAEINAQYALESKKIDTLKQELQSSMVTGNKFVIATIKTLFKVHNDHDYPRGYYITIIILLSLLISFILETIIWGSFTILSINHGTAYANSFKNQAIEEELREDFERDHRIEKLKSQQIKDKILDQYKNIKDMINRMGRS